MAKDKTLKEVPSPRYHKIVSKYSARFKAGTDDDQTNVTEEERRVRRDASTKLAEEYYEFATDAYERGWSTHFHYTPYAPNESTQQAQAFYEHRLAFLTGLKPGMKVLDIGCGIGAPAREIAKFIGCEIVGISINQSHIDRAIELSAQEGLSHLCTFVKADFLNLCFATHSFDAAYAIEATVHAPSYAQVYAQISRVLKPGAPFGLSEWVLTPNFDPNNPMHIGIRNRIERGNGLANIDKSEVAGAGLVSAGFEVVHEEDYAERWRNIHKFADESGTKSTSKSKSNLKNETPPSSLTRSPILIPFSFHPDPILAPLPTRPVSLHPSHRSGQPRPWWHPLQGRTELAATAYDYWTAWRMKPLTRKTGYAGIWFLEKILHVYPRGACEAMNTIGLGVDSVVEGGIEGVFSPCWWFICRKVGEPVVDGAEVAGQPEIRSGGGGGGGGPPRVEADQEAAIGGRN